MTIEHYIVFVGAGAPLATELFSIGRRISKSKIVAPAVQKKHVGTTETAVRLASIKLYNELALEDKPSPKARLYLWMYEPTSFAQFELVWKMFGHASWVETIPRVYLHKVKYTKEYLQNRINEVRPLLHEISGAAYAQRKSSPLALPLRNFSSQITRDLRSYWYNDLNQNQIAKQIKSFKNQYSQTKSRTKQGYRDDKALIFKPANYTECHGKPHPMGSECKSFFCGKFRFGVSLFPGFHFDVSAEYAPTIQCNLRTASGTTRSIRSERRRYINIFPNDFLLPEK